jgi:hypothetical protein
MILAGLVLVAAALPMGTTCTHSLLPAPALALVKPLMQLRDREADDEFTADGHWKKESPIAPQVNDAFERILHDRSTAGDQALVYLLHVYLGEDRGEEIECELINRGKKILPLIHQYEECTPTTGLEPYGKWVTAKESLSGFAIHGITTADACDEMR